MLPFTALCSISNGLANVLGEGNGNPLQCSCLENPRDGGSLVGCHLWGRTESDTTEATAAAAAANVQDITWPALP